MSEERQSDAWKAAHEKRQRANDLAEQAAKAAAEAGEAEARALADDAGVEYDPADPNEGTWEASVKADSGAQDDAESSEYPSEDQGE